MRSAHFHPAALALALPAAAVAQLRIATWNVTTYSSTLPSPRDAAFKTALYAQFDGRSLAPDLLIGQEFTSAAAVTSFLALLNSAPGSPADWAAAPFLPGPDTGSALFYRLSRVTFDSVTTISHGGPSPEPPRDTQRYDLRPRGYGPAATLSIYSLHLKSGSAADDSARRLTEAARVRADAATLTHAFIVAGDLNIPSHTEPAYQALVAAPPAGRVFDPIARPGLWNNASTFRFVHTQAPGGTASQTGGMDDRFDQLLLSQDLVDSAAMDYAGVALQPYSAATWNDPAHSYRAWGNDGSSYNAALTVTGNQMVGPAIAQALRDSASADNTGGHLPVYLDLLVPGKVAAPLALDFGTVPPGVPADCELQVRNDADTNLWTAAGIAPLRYHLETTPGFTVPAGFFVVPPAASAPHTIRLTGQASGPVEGVLTIHSDDPDVPQRLVALSGFICTADCDRDGLLTLADFGCFQTKFATGDPYADCNGDGALNLADFGCFQTRFALGCP